MHSNKMGLWILQLKVHFSQGIIKNHHNCYLRFAFLVIEHFQKSTSLIMYLNFHLINYKSSSVVFLFEVSCFCLHQAPFKYLSIPPILLLYSVFAHLWNENREKCVRLGCQIYIYIYIYIFFFLTKHRHRHYHFPDCLVTWQLDELP